MIDSQILHTIEALAAKCIRLEARCDALGVALAVVAARQGLPPEKVLAAVDKLTARCHQAALERIEDIDAGLAASVDLRPLAASGLFD